MTKAKILQFYELEVKTRYPRAADAEKLARFMRVARDMLDGMGPGVDRNGAGWKAALHQAGLPTNMSLQALLALPAGD